MKKSVSVLTTAAMVGLFLVGAPMPLWAVDGTWNSTSEGDYTNSANWASSQMPDATGTATFNSNASYQVDWSTSVTNGAVNFAAPGGQVTLNIGSGNAWTLANALAVGTNAGATAKALVSSGMFSVTNSAGKAITTVGTTNGIGVLAQTGGRINLNTITNMPGGIITNSGGVMMINGTMVHRGSLYVMNGGAVSNTGPQIAAMYGTTNVISGTGSRLYLANGVYDQSSHATSPSTFLISGGGCFNAGSQDFIMGAGAANSGDSMLITDPGSWVTSGYRFWVGCYGTANCIVTNGGGLVNSSSAGNSICVAGNGAANCSLVITGTGSYVRVTGAANAGDPCIKGNGGRIELRNGASWTNTSTAYMYIPENNSSNCKLLITDPGTTFTSGGHIWVGASSATETNNSLTVTNLATVTCQDVFIAAYNGCYSNYVSVCAGGIMNVRNFGVGWYGRANSNNFALISGGTIKASGWVDVHGGWLGVQNNGVVASAGQLTLTSGVQSVVLISDGTVTNGGMVVGDSALVSVSGASHLQVNGPFTNSTGASTVQFIGTPSAVGRIDVTGLWTNSATAKLTVDLSKYTWPSGSSVTLATFGAMPVQYAAGNITVSNKSVIVKQTASAIIAMKSAGTAVFFR